MVKDTRYFPRQLEEKHSWDYKQNGADWAKLFPACGLTNQSPIDLMSDGLPSISYEEDDFNKIYTNQLDDIIVNWNGHTSQVALDKPGQNFQRISSWAADELFDATQHYDALQFHFHRMSEHTIDGGHTDLEMHIVHLAQEDYKGQHPGDVKYAAMGIMFSVSEYTAEYNQDQADIIDTFFEGLRWQEQDENPLVEKVYFGDLMMSLNTWDRWVYKGSVTTPPCDKFVYWNVLRTVYPIKAKHIDLFEQQLSRTKSQDLKSTGNNRMIQPTDLNDVHITTGDPGMSLMPLFIIVMIILAGILAFLSYKLYLLLSSQQKVAVMPMAEEVQLATEQQNLVESNPIDQVKDKMETIGASVEEKALAAAEAQQTIENQVQ